jgi:hypothetical protein
MLWTLVVSSAASNVRGGRIVGSRLANMLFPVPGGPINSMLYAVLQLTLGIQYLEHLYHPLLLAC